MAILVGNHPSSKAYIGRKMKAAKLVGKCIFDSDKQSFLLAQIYLFSNILFINNQELRVIPFIWEKT